MLKLAIKTQENFYKFTQKKMIEQILKFITNFRIKTRFGTHHGFNKNIKELISTFRSIELDTNMMEWVLPIDSLSIFTKECNKLGIPFEITDYTQSNKTVKIEKYLTRYSVIFDYDETLVEFIRTLDKRYWDKELKKWLLPIQTLTKFTEKCNELGYTIDSIDAIPFKQNSNQPINNYDKKECKAYISYEEKQFNLKFSTYVNKFDDFRNIDKSVSYNKENQTFTFSIEKLHEVLALLHKDNIRYIPIDKMRHSYSA